MKKLPRLELRLLESVDLGVKSASAIAPLGDGLALVIDDDEGIFLVGGAGAPVLLRGREDHAALGDLESVCLSGDHRTAWAVSEERGQLFSFEVRRARGRVTLSAPTRLGILPRPGDAENKGWEGVAWLPPSGDRPPALLLVHERKPKALGLFTLPSLEPGGVALLDGPLDDLLGDVADVAICPTSGRVLLLSDRSQRVVEVRLRFSPLRVEAVAACELPLEEGEKPEGIAFEAEDRIVVVTDRSGRLLRFQA